MKLTLLLLAVTGAPYDDAIAEAIRTKRPLVVGVGCAAPANKKWVTVNMAALEGYTAPCIILAIPDGKWMYWRKTLPPTATVEEIWAVFSVPAARDPEWRAQPFGTVRKLTANC